MGVPSESANQASASWPKEYAFLMDMGYEVIPIAPTNKPALVIDNKGGKLL